MMNSRIPTGHHDPMKRPTHSKRRKSHRLRPRQRLGKYSIEKCLFEGSYAAVYRAYDTIEGVRVALKIPHIHMMDEDFLDDFRREVRLASRLDHERVLAIRNANYIGDYFVIAYSLGEETLADRISRRLSTKSILDLSEQCIEAVAHAHAHHVLHCDIKPENFILFRGSHVRLTDFGIAKIAMRTLEDTGSGTVGYMAPEHAMGRPSFPSDVFSLGLLLYKMLSGSLPEWPFAWPPTAFDRLKRRAHPELIEVIRKSLEFKPARRYRDAQQMLTAFRRVKRKAMVHKASGKRRRRTTKTARDWRQVRYDQFRKSFGRLLESRHSCPKCEGPVSESMRACPWCGMARKKHRDDVAFPARCPRCERGVKLDWLYCPWCFGPGFKNVATRSYGDKRYEAFCSNPACRGELMPFMKYCPWCKRAVKKPWKIEGVRDKCPSCRCGVVEGFWLFCPWCTKRIGKR